MNVISIGKRHIKKLAICSLAVLILAGVIFSSAVTRQLNDWKLLPQPERLTELYYENHSKLPRDYTPDTAQQFSFTVHNLEYRTTNYTYQVLERSADSSQTKQLANGSLSLQQNDHKTTAMTITPVDLGQRVQIITNLQKVESAHQGQTAEVILYWVDHTPIPYYLRSGA